MERVERYKRILESLHTISSDLERGGRLESHLKKVRDAAPLEELHEDFEDMRVKMASAVRNCKTVIESPIYVGVVGHYSHGKSSLLNAMLVPKKVLLPIGNGIVTGMCTLIQFDHSTSRNQYFQVYHDGTEDSLDESEYQRKVSGHVRLAESTSHFRLLLSTNEMTEKGVFEQMAKNRIELLDTPGLGGPYWKDEENLARWIKQFMLVIVCIKADKIDPDTAEAVDPFLRQAGRPVIPVVTFWDLWKDAECYSGISDFKKARAKAKEDIGKFFPSLRDAVHRTEFVSAGNLTQGIHVDEDLKEQFTDDWNIDNCRRRLQSYVSAEMGPIRGTEDRTATRLDHNKIQRVLSSCEGLNLQFEAVKKKMQDSMSRASMDGDELNDLIEQGTDDVMDRLKGFYEKKADELRDMISTELSLCRTSNGPHRGGFDEIYRKTDDSIQKLKSELGEKATHIVDRYLTDKLTKYVRKQKHIAEDKQNRLIKQTKAVCSDFVDELKASLPSEVFEPPIDLVGGVQNYAEAIWNGLKSLFFRNFYLFLVVVAVIIFLPLVGSLISWLLPPHVKVYLWAGIAVVLGLTLIATLSKEIVAARNRTRMEAIERAREAHGQAVLAKKITPDLEQRTEELGNKIRREIREVTRPVVDTGERMKDEIQDIMRDVSEKLKKIEAERRAIVRELEAR